MISLSRASSFGASATSLGYTTSAATTVRAATMPTAYLMLLPIAIFLSLRSQSWGVDPVVAFAMPQPELKVTATAPAGGGDEHPSTGQLGTIRRGAPAAPLDAPDAGGNCRCPRLPGRNGVLAGIPPLDADYAGRVALRPMRRPPAMSVSRPPDTACRVWRRYDARCQIQSRQVRLRGR